VAPPADSRGVVQVLRLDEDAAHPEEAFLELGEVDARAQVAELDGKVRVLHLPRHRLLEALLEAERRVDVQLRARDEGGNEERKALDVVPVRVADEEVQTERLGHRLQEVQPELARARPAVQHDDRPVWRPELHARGVAAETGRAIAG
jgi:hypothetical protein